MTIKYNLKLLSDWHCSSGLSSGANADLCLIKDDNGLPFVPGRTIKGLLKDALYEMADIQTEYKGLCDKYFGVEVDNETKEKTDTKDSIRGKAHFSSAYLPSKEQEDLLNSPALIPFLFRNISQTKIDENGIAKSKSLRTIEVCMPLELEGEIANVEQEDVQQIEAALKWTRRLGMNRNRGLGRCQFIVKAKKEA